MADGIDEPTYTLDDLADALVAERWSRKSAEPLRAYHRKRFTAFVRAFGLEDEAHPRTLDGWLLRVYVDKTITAMLVKAHPFSGILEAPAKLVALGERYGPAIDAAEDARQAALRTLLLGMLEELVRKTVVTEDELRAHGLDPSAIAPDPYDFL